VRALAPYGATARPRIVVGAESGRAITSVYLHGIDNAEIIETVHVRRQPMIPVRTSLPR
jgi:hypothetical protein